MNFLDIRAGDNIEVGTQLAFRFWRYVFPPFEAPLRLLSWVSSMRWHPGQFVEGTTPDIGRQGIHGYKSMDELIDSINGNPDNLLFRCKLTETDGVIIGTVALWGTIWDHARGYGRNLRVLRHLYPLMAIGIGRPWPSSVRCFLPAKDKMSFFD